MTSSLLDDRSVLPPGLCFELRQAFDRLEPHRGTTDEAVLRELWRLFDEAEPWVGLVPELAELGFRYLDPERHHTVRQFACAWLTLFPSAETMRRLSAVALADDTPGNVREQAVWSLGFRQARRQPESVQWSLEAVEIADGTLIELAHRAAQAGRIPFDNLPLALRHVQSPAWFQLMARDLPFWGQAIEAFADPALGVALLDQFERIPQAHQLRACRLAAATLGEQAIARLLQLAELRQGLTLELRLLAVALGGEAQLGQLEDSLASSRFTEDARRRAKWHLEHPGRVPRSAASSSRVRRGSSPARSENKPVPKPQTILAC